ncbi:siderophore-interacting protein [Actinophytocola xanthii]|uniref:NADPH-dependent ferric siderophore reductase n=1 Tax=Actinophytocola xanthii TaxID=1912961 RepID=A0A1Q8CS73_9PSEU|nr:siderophore-interacting protein [Actinophytocola xanthii]OLF17222.1 NADPH-dependent ferric siderophore reductase [Actinophytocola xanthii]
MTTAQRPMMATVTATRSLTERMVRITLAGEELHSFAHVGPDQLVRLFLPTGPGAPPLPATSDWWPELCAMPEATRPVLRNYTVRRHDPVRRELDIDFVLHGHGLESGPGSTWAAGAAPGDRIGVLSDGADYAPPADTTWQLLVGDEAAVPAIAAILEQLTCPAVVLIEVADALDELPLAIPPGTSVSWLHRRDAVRGEPAVAAVRALELPEGVPYVWVAGESALATGVRRHLVKDRGLAKERIYFCGYWRAG